jgi:acyl carrier protein
MNIDDFIKKIEEEYDDLSPGKLKPEIEFRKALEWNSINALIMISLIDTEYNVQITADELRKAVTVSDLFNTVKKKLG